MEEAKDSPSINEDDLEQAYLDVVRRMREYLTRGWCKFTFARDRFGSPVASCSPDAVCWCFEGARNVAMNDWCDAHSPRVPPGFVTTMSDRISYRARIILRRYGHIEPHSGGLTMTPSKWQDSPGVYQDDVLALVDRLLDVEGLKDDGGAGR